MQRASRKTKGERRRSIEVETIKIQDLNSRDSYGNKAKKNTQVFINNLFHDKSKSLFVSFCFSFLLSFVSIRNHKVYAGDCNDHPESA